MKEENKKLLIKVANILDAINIEQLDSEMINFCVKFSKLSEEEKNLLFENFFNNIDFYYSSHIKSENRERCALEGHLYTNWEERPIFNNYHGSSFKNRVWHRECMRCGETDLRYVNPNKIVIEENKTETPKEIVDTSKRRLVRLRSKK